MFGMEHMGGRWSLQLKAITGCNSVGGPKTIGFTDRKPVAFKVKMKRKDET